MNKPPKKALNARVIKQLTIKILEIANFEPFIITIVYPKI
jgi:hypothetical protein